MIDMPIIKQDINQVILFQIERTSKIAKQHSQRTLDELGINITIEQWILLKIIEESKELSQKELAVKSLRDPASITRTLDILVKKGFVLRQEIVNNRRKYQIVLTTSGKKFVEKNLPVIEEQRALSTKGFSKEELETLSNFLKRIQNNMS